MPLKVREFNVCLFRSTTEEGSGTYPNGFEYFCPSVIAQFIKPTTDFAFCAFMDGFLLNSLYRIRYVKLEIGYEFCPGALVSVTLVHGSVPFGKVAADASTAAAVEFIDGKTKLPSLF